MAGGNLQGTTGAGQGTTRAGAPRSPTVVGLPLLLLGAGVRAQELGKGPVPGQQLLVGAHLGDLATTHDDDDIHLGQVADAVRDQDPRLRAEPRPHQRMRARGKFPAPPPPTWTQISTARLDMCLGCKRAEAFQSARAFIQHALAGSWGRGGSREGNKDSCPRFQGRGRNDQRK